MAHLDALDRITSETVSALEDSKKQVYDVFEDTRREYQRVKKELEEAEKEISEIEDNIKELEEKEKQAQKKLTVVSHNFSQYTENDIKKTYEQAHQLQLKLQDLRHREQITSQKQEQLENNLRELESTLSKAEKMISHLGVVLNYLTSNSETSSEKMQEIQQLQQMGFNIIRAQEEERKRVAREIHDGPAQLLANIAMRTEFCRKLLEVDPYKARRELEDLQELTRKSIKDVRQVIFDLRPMVLDDLGLIAATKRYLSEYKTQNNVETELVTRGSDEKHIPQTVKVAAFRIIQECLSNIKKHSSAKHVTLKIEISEKQVNITIRDDGVGFDVNSLNQKSSTESYGLVNMRERAGLIKGKVDIQSAPGKGTTVTLSIPLE